MNSKDEKAVIYSDAFQNIKIADKSNILKKYLPAKVSVSSGKILIEKTDLNITSDRGIFISDINDPVFTDVVKAILVYQRNGFIVLGFDDNGRLVDLDYNSIQLMQEYPQYYNRVAIYDLQPTQEQKTIMHMLENEYGSKPVYSDQDNAFQSFKIQTAEAFMKLYQSLEDYQIDLLKNLIHSMMALIEAISCFEK